MSWRNENTGFVHLMTTFLAHGKYSQMQVVLCAGDTTEKT